MQITSLYKPTPSFGMGAAEIFTKTCPAGLRGILLVMKLTTVLLLAAMLQAAAKSNAQTVTYAAESVSLEKVFVIIKQQTGYVFFYRVEDLTGLPAVSVSFRNTPLATALQEALKGQPLQYNIQGKTIFITAAGVNKKKNTIQEETIAEALAKEITGVVRDKNGGPLEGVSVTVKGTQTGTTTNADGRFRLSVPSANVELVFSFVGYATQTVKAGSRTVFDIVLEEAVADLSDVVVVGYGTQNKVNLTGSVSKISTDAFADMPALRVDQMLQGRASGMMVTQVNGTPGASSSIRIRGNSSITASSEPLYVIDGLLGVGDLSTINPNDIEDITVLKDASTTAIYGSQGANGVILITTKRGRIGPAKINIGVQQGSQWLPRKLDLLSGPEYAELLNESRIAAGGQAVYPDPQSVKTTDWQEEVMHTAQMTNVNAGFTGGSKDIRYYVSANYFNQEGIIKNSGVRRLQLRANLEGKLSEKLKIGISMNAGRIKTRNNTVSLAPQWSLLTTAPSMPVYNEDGSYNYNYPNSQFNGRFNTPIAQQNLIKSEGDRGDIMINSFVEYSPFEWLSIKSTYGGQMFGFGGSYNYTDSRLPGQTTNNEFGRAGMSYNKYSNFQNENTISFSKLIGRDHFLEGVIGATFQGGASENESAGAYRFESNSNLWHNLTAGDPATYSISSGYQNWGMSSFLGRVSYKYKDRYLLTAVTREDGSSRLGNGNKWAFFPSLAIGWIASNEAFLKDLNSLSFLKLKASYGKVGNQAVDIYQTMSILTAYPTIVGNQRVSGWLPGQVSGNISIKGNPNLKWEVKNQLDLGIEAGFFENRLNFTFDYYNAVTKDLLLLTQIPTQTGYTQQMTNVGEVSNTGIELRIGSDNIRRSVFSWSTDITLSYNKNKVLRLGADGADIVTHTYTWGVKPIGILRVGEPIGSFFGYVSDGIWKENQGAESTMPGAPAGSVRYKDITGDGIVNVEDNVILGNGSPNWYGGIGNSLTYGNFGLNFFFSGALGAKMFNGNAPFMRSTDAQYNHYREVLDRFHPVDNPDSDIPGALNLDRETQPSDRWVFDASYIRLESVNLSYRIPLGEHAKRVIKNATVTLAGLNLFCLSPYNRWGYDPVINVQGGNDLGYRNSLRGFDYGAYPKAASLSVGINATF
ncbi:MAG: TonB-dependent receptor [Chitinophagaceae bacterium]|nr:TonB-dependent receptor [Chitinophagaceae bacterium]